LSKIGGPIRSGMACLVVLIPGRSSKKALQAFVMVSEALAAEGVMAGPGFGMGALLVLDLKTRECSPEHLQQKQGARD
jgi:hypothetical protein